MSTSSEIFDLLGITDIDGYYDNIKLLIDLDPSVLQSTDNHGNLPIHTALVNQNITCRVIQLLLDSLPESISQPNPYGDLPIHCLCENKNIDETVSVEILNYLIQAYPESVQHGTSHGELPIHVAVGASMSPKFLKILVDAYPESVRIPLEVDRKLPIHWACSSVNCSVDVVKYLLDVYPESINVEAHDGWLPIHMVAYSNGPQKADVIEHLLSKDPTYASKLTRNGECPLHLACFIGPNLAAVQVLFDAYPEAVLKRNRNGRTPLKLARERAEINDDNVTEDNIAYLNSQRAQVINFLQTQLFYANSSPESLVVQDENGWTRLHRALKDNAPLGSIKLLVKKSVDTVQIADLKNAFPLHIACEFSSVKVVQYMIEMLDERTRNHLDVNKDSILHYACQGGNYEVVRFLLDKQSPHVTERNADQKLPIQLFCESGSSTNTAGEGDPQTNSGEEEEGRPRVAPELFGTISDLFFVSCYSIHTTYSHSFLCLYPLSLDLQ